MSQKEDFEFSPKWHFAKYYLLMSERLDEFLNNEKVARSTNLSHNPAMAFTRTLTRTLSNAGPSFKEYLKQLKGSLFLINNYDHMLAFFEEINVMDLMKKMNPQLESNIRKNIDANMEKTTKLFEYLSAKWEKCNMPLHQSSKVRRKEEIIIMLREVLESLFKIVVISTSSNEAIRRVASEHLSPILNDLQASGELLFIANELKIRYDHYGENKRSLKTLIIDRIFPNSSF